MPDSNELATEIDSIVNEVGEMLDRNPTPEDRDLRVLLALLDTAIVVSRVAHVYDRDENGVFWAQRRFRQEQYLTTTLEMRVIILRERDWMQGLEPPRSLTVHEKERFVLTHGASRRGAGGHTPILTGEDMSAFLECQKVFHIQANAEDLNFHGLSSFDGTRLYVADGADEYTVPHELEHNIRRYIMATDPVGQASLVSPRQDTSLRVNNTQCESGFVSEHYNGIRVPPELISPFSAKWTRFGFR